jgi:ferredoxin
MKSPYSYVVFDCERCIDCQVCIPNCPGSRIIYDSGNYCLMADKEACMGCYCDTQCIEVCPADAITLKYEKPTTPTQKVKAG